MRSIKDLENIKGKRALVRVDYNVPIAEGVVQDDFRIEKSIPTILYLHKNGAHITLLTHLGKDGSQSLEPVKRKFFELSGLPEHEINFFENVRKFPGEENNDPEFAKKLAALGDFYVNDAFSVSHREHASVVGIPKYLPAYAGLQLEEEIRNLSLALQNPEHPFLFILGGAKFSTKLPLIEKYLELADNIFLGGALSNDALKAKGFEVGKSMVDETGYDISGVVENEKIIIPVDVTIQVENKLVNKGVDEVGPEETILDVGEDTLRKLKLYIDQAKLILWNGPLGKYEVGGERGTKLALQMVADSKAKSIIGGGDTVALISEMKMENKFSFVSTGGGATLEFLSKGTLPGIEALG